MKTTIEVPDELYRRAETEAALRGRKLEDLIEEGLRLVLDSPRPGSHRRSLAKLMEPARGVAGSGVHDLASNKEYLARFGRNTRRHR
jgi:hypothetical protein